MENAVLAIWHRISSSDDEPDHGSMRFRWRLLVWLSTRYSLPDQRLCRDLVLIILDNNSRSTLKQETPVVYIDTTYIPCQL